MSRNHNLLVVGTLGRCGLCLALLVGVLGTQSAQALNFADSSRVNVLREYNQNGTNLISFTPSGSWTTTSGVDGSGYPDQITLPSGTAMMTYTLPGPRTVGSYNAGFHGSFLPANFKLEGLVSGIWTQLANLAPGAEQSGSFTPQTVTSLRYTVTGPGGVSNIIQNQEMQVFLSSGQTIDNASGYNYIHDLGKVSASGQSTEAAGVWSPMLGGSVAAAFNGDYTLDSVHSQDNDRAFLRMTLNQDTQMDFAHLGWYGGQQWTNYEMYTSSAASAPASQALGASTQAAITGAGWTLQHSVAGVSGQEAGFILNTPGLVRHVLLVWDSFPGAGALAEFEGFDLPSPVLLSNPLTGSQIDFGKLINTPSLTLTDAVFLKNNGQMGSTINVTGYSITGADAGQFSVPDFAITTLIAGGSDSVSFDVQFNPLLELRAYNALLTLNTSSGNVVFNLTGMTAIPEPSSLSLCALAGLMLVVRRRRSSRSGE